MWVFLVCFLPKFDNFSWHTCGFHLFPNQVHPLTENLFFFPTWPILVKLLLSLIKLGWKSGRIGGFSQKGLRLCCYYPQTIVVFQDFTLLDAFWLTSQVLKWLLWQFSSQDSLAMPYPFSSVAQSCPTLCDPMNPSTPGLPVHHQLPEFTQTHVHRVGDAIQPSHSLSSPSPLAPNPSQHQSLFQWVNSSHEVAKVLEFQL